MTNVARPSRDAQGLRDAVCPADLPARVAQEHVVQALLSGQGLVRCLVVGADAHCTAGTGSAEVLVRVTEGADLAGTDGRLVPRVKKSTTGPPARNPSSDHGFPAASFSVSSGRLSFRIVGHLGCPSPPAL